MSQATIPIQQLNHFKIQISPKYIKVQILFMTNNRSFHCFKTSPVRSSQKKGQAKFYLLVFFVQQKEKKVVFNEEAKDIDRRFASLILGIITIENQKMLVYVKNVYYQGEMTKGFRVYQIAQVQFVSLGPLLPQTRQIMQIMEKQIFSFSFYFSLERDLTLSFQDFYKDKSNKPKNRYFWNYEMLTHLIVPENNKESDQAFYKSEWCIPVIQGHFGSFSYLAKDQDQIQVFLISRRSKYRSGTRFYNRGLDESGRCANFIQTEVAMLRDNTLTSTRYFSGSVPLFWQQISQLSKVKLTRDRNFTSFSFQKHIKHLVKQNQHIFLINLLQKKKQNQYLLIKEYEHHVQSLGQEYDSTLRYAYWDINCHDKLEEYEKTWEFVEGLFDITESFKSFEVNLKTNIVYSTQKGAYRVSCLDCLARTNRFLKVLGLQSLCMNLEKDHYFKESFKELCLQLLSSKDQQLNPFLRYYKTIWDEKGEFESIIYSGSPSTHSKKTKLIDKIENTIISLQRYYNQKFIDQMKQLSLDIILYHKSYEPLLFRLKHKLPFTVSIATWNVNAVEPDKLSPSQLQKLFCQFQKSDLIVVGIQEMIELNTNNVMNDNTDESARSEKWKNVIESFLNNKTMISGEYVFVQKLEMVGLFMIMFISKKWAHSLRSVHKDVVKTGMKIGVSEKYGNKGGIVIRISILQTSLTFVCAHLAAHQNKVKDRINDLVEIHKKAFQQNKQSIQNELEIDFSDYKFFFGDLNFRLNGDFHQIKDLIEQNQQQTTAKKSNASSFESRQSKREKICQNLMQKDQLYLLMNTQTYNSTLQQSQDPSSDYLKLYRESPIYFFPTYKLNKHTGEYTLQKSRNPSYCDRILFWKNYGCDELNVDEEVYTDVRIKGSDHRPVFGRFVVNILKETRKNSQSVILEESYLQEDDDQQQQGQLNFLEREMQDKM